MKIENNPNSISTRIEYKRKQLGLTQSQLAEASDLSTQFINAIINNRKGLGPESIVKIARALGVSTDYLLTGKPNDVEIGFLKKVIRNLDAEQYHCVQEIILQMCHGMKVKIDI